MKHNLLTMYCSQGMAAKNQLEQMRAEDQLALNKKEITAGAQKRAVRCS